LTSSGLSADEVGKVFRHAILDLGVAKGAESQIAFVMDALTDDHEQDSETKKLIAKWAPGPVVFHDLRFSAPYFNDTDAAELLNQTVAIWFTYGNAYKLEAALRLRTRFVERTVLPRIRAGSLLYVGQNAGAIVAGQDVNIARCQHGDQCQEREKWDLGEDSSGLALVPCDVRPSYSGWMDEFIREFRGDKMKSGPCPDCAILRFPEHTAYYWAGDGSDAQYVSSPLDPLIGTLDSFPPSHYLCVFAIPTVLVFTIFCGTLCWLRRRRRGLSISQAHESRHLEQALQEGDV